MPILTSTRLRRVASATAALAVAATTLGLATAPAEASPPAACVATFTPTSIGPGQSSTLDLSGDTEPTYALYASVDGGAPDGYNIPQSLPDDMPFSYSWARDMGVESTLEMQVYLQGDVIGESSPLCTATLTLTAALLPQTVSFDPPATHDLSGGFSLFGTATATSGLDVSFASETTSVCSVLPAGYVIPLSAGTCTVTATQEGDATYAAADPVTEDIEIEAWTQAITFAPLADVRIDHGPVALSASSTMDLTVDLASETPGVCTISDDEAVLVAPGTCTVTATQPGAPGTVLAATPVTRSFEVLPLPVPPVTPTPDLDPAKLRLSAPAGLPLSAGTTTYGVRSNGTAPITVRSVNPSVCRVTGSGDLKLRAVGTCRLRATQAADAGHLAAAPVTASFPVWGFPAVPAKARATEVLDVLGKGEAAYRVVATPAAVCRETDGAVVLIDGGACRIEVRSGGKVVRTGTVTVSVPAKPAAVQHSMDLGATVYFAFDSARLTAAGKAVLRKVAPKLAKADLVVVYGHTYGPGKNSPRSRALAADRAQVTVAYLSRLGVESKAVSEVAMAMQQPVSSTAWKNRRAEVYYR